MMVEMIPGIVTSASVSGMGRQAAVCSPCDSSLLLRAAGLPRACQHTRGGGRV